MLGSRLARTLAAALLGALAFAGFTSSWSRDRPCADPAGAPGQGVDFVTAVARQAPAVVSVLAVGQDSDGGDNDELGIVPRPRLGSQRTSASGFIVSADGYILTSAHAVLGAQELSVLLGGQRRLAAEVVGLDRRTDVAVLKITATNLPVAAIGSSARLCAGEWVAALGSPFGFEQSVTAGMDQRQPALPARRQRRATDTDRGQRRGCGRADRSGQGARTDRAERDRGPAGQARLDHLLCAGDAACRRRPSIALICDKVAAGPP